MIRSKRFMRTVAWSVLAVVTLVAVIVAVPAAAVPSMETHAYYSVVRDTPYAPYTAADTLMRTSVHAYYSVVQDLAYAPYTESEVLKRTSLHAYYSVLH